MPNSHTCNCLLCQFIAGLPHRIGLPLMYSSGLGSPDTCLHSSSVGHNAAPVTDGKSMCWHYKRQKAGPPRVQHHEGAGGVDVPLPHSAVAVRVLALPQAPAPLHLAWVLGVCTVAQCVGHRSILMCKNDERSGRLSPGTSRPRMRRRQAQHSIDVWNSSIRSS